MILCEIGNSFLHFYHNGKTWREKADNLSQKDQQELVIFISVNENNTQSLLYSHPRCFDLAPYMRLDTGYEGIGIDRVAACLSTPNGIIIDAGSAVTVDIMQDGMHLGGFIMPGFDAFNGAFRKISSKLDYNLNMGVSLEAIPQNTQDALSYGVLQSIILMIKHWSKGKKIYFTGGDGKFLSRFFAESIFDDLLVFKGMQFVITEKFSKKGILL